MFFPIFQAKIPDWTQLIYKGGQLLPSHWTIIILEVWSFVDFQYFLLILFMLILDPVGHVTDCLVCLALKWMGETFCWHKWLWFQWFEWSYYTIWPRKAQSNLTIILFCNLTDLAVLGSLLILFSLQGLSYIFPQPAFTLLQFAWTFVHAQ